MNNSFVIFLAIMGGWVISVVGSSVLTVVVIQWLDRTINGRR